MAAKTVGAKRNAVVFVASASTCLILKLMRPLVKTARPWPTVMAILWRDRNVADMDDHGVVGLPSFSPWITAVL